MYINNHKRIILMYIYTTHTVCVVTHSAVWPSAIRISTSWKILLDHVYAYTHAHMYQ